MVVGQFRPRPMILAPMGDARIDRLLQRVDGDEVKVVD